MLNQVIDNFEFNSFDKSLDIKDFDVADAFGIAYYAREVLTNK